MMEGIVSIMHKKNDRDDITNYRPITLLNGDYKIYTRVLTRRLNKVVTEFVADCQKGFVPRAFIGEATMLLNSLSTIMEAEEGGSGGGTTIFGHGESF